MNFDAAADIAQPLSNFFAGSCSPLFATSALTSLIMGERSRWDTLQNTREKISFAQHLDERRRQYEDEKFDTELLEKRLQIERGRARQLIEADLKLQQQRTQVEFQHFLKECWPLKTTIHTAWHLETLLDPATPVPLILILARPNSAAATTPLLDDYPNITETLNNHTRHLGNITHWQDAWKDPVNKTNGNAPALNIHHILQGRPTLVILPRLLDDTLHLDATYWSFTPDTIHHHHFLHLPLHAANYALQKEKIRLALLAITGAIRDAYITLEYNQPATLPTLAHHFAPHPDILQNIIHPQYAALHTHLAAPTELSTLRDTASHARLTGALRPFLQN